MSNLKKEKNIIKYIMLNQGKCSGESAEVI